MKDDDCSSFATVYSVADPLTFGSLFAGVGGLDLGLERAGIKCRWQVEIDEYASRVLERHWPNVRRHDDVQTFTDIEYVDIVCGGFPCQDVSNAGHRAGIDGERSGLFFELMRIVRDVGPRYVLLENVSALLVRGMDRVLSELAASGYDAEWEWLPASAFGAYHNRDRVFILAYREGASPRVFEEQGARQKPQLQHRRLVSHSACQSRLERNDRFEDEPRVARMVMGFPHQWTLIQGPKDVETQSTQGSQNGSTNDRRSREKRGVGPQNEVMKATNKVHARA